LGGALGLLHYLDYRHTHDVDAWWVPSVTAQDREEVLKVIVDALQPFGEVQSRHWGEVASIELAQEGRVIFSFQIAGRSAQLQPSTSAPWIAVLLDSFPDLVASKMVALVERGAPRDFRDIYAVCQAGLTSPAECWQWWRQCQEMAGSDTNPERAHLAIETHLARISQHRPLARIGERDMREAAQRVRTWFSTEFLDALLD
jgi:hypothetical protein